MVATFWLLSWAFGPAQTTNRPVPATPTPAPAARGSDAVLTPRLARGQELVYRGAFTEEALGDRVQFQRAYRFESRFFVLEAPAKGVELAAFTLLDTKGPRPAASSHKPDVAPASVRLERLTLDLQGNLSAAGGMNLAVPIDAAPTLEVGAFVPAPSGRHAVTNGWEVAEPGRPPRHWRLVGTESVNGQACVKLVGTQQSDDWEKPRADRSAWRRQDTLWVGSRTGLTQKVERVIEQREPARRDVARRSVMRYDLESSLQYPAQMALDRRQEIARAFDFRDAARPMVAEPTKYATQLQALSKKIAYHLESNAPTPYREAVQFVRRQVETACRGEVVRVAHEELPAAAVPVAAAGEPAPDFVAGPLTTKESGKLAAWKGKPILLVFYHPASYTAEGLLRFAQQVQASHGRQLTVVGLSVSDDASQVLRQREAMKLDFPIYSGGGMRKSYGVESTPKLVVIDAAGVIRGMYLGWGSETALEVTAELRRWLPGH
jgi:peroxiredoxin